VLLRMIVIDFNSLATESKFSESNKKKINDVYDSSMLKGFILEIQATYIPHTQENKLSFIC
jgi:hypothetical protein